MEEPIYWLIPAIYLVALFGVPYIVIKWMRSEQAKKVNEKIEKIDRVSGQVILGVFYLFFKTLQGLLGLGIMLAIVVLIVAIFVWAFGTVF